MANFLNIDGTQEAAFKINGPAGPQIKNDAGTFKLRNTGDSADAAVSASTATVSTSIIFDQTNDLTVDAPNQTGAARIASFPALGANDQITCNDAVQTLAGKTLTTPTIVNAGSIIDGNANEYVKFEQTNLAVNEITIKNNIANNPPQILATGGDANVTLGLIAKGTGAVFVGSGTATEAGRLEIGDNDNSASVAFEAADVTTTYVLKMPAGIGTQNQILEISSIAGNVATMGFINSSAVSGAQQVIRFTRAGSAGAGTATSTTTMPANTIVQQVIVNVTGALNNSATVQVGTSDTADLFMGTGDSDLLSTGIYSKFVDSTIGVAARQVQIIVGGTPAAGSFDVTVVYCEAPLA